MADELRASPQSPGLAVLARLLSGTHEFASRPFGYENPPARMLSEMLGLPATARTVERMSYGEPLTTGRGMTTRMRPDTEEALMAVAPLASPLAKAAPVVARELAPAAGALAMRAAEVGGMPVHGLGVIKPKGGNWLAGSVESSLRPMRSLVSGSDPAKRIADIQVSRAQNLEAGVPIDEERIAALMSELEPRAAMNKWLEKKLGTYIRNEMGTPEDPIRALAERGVTHSEVAPLNTYDLNLLGRRRESVGFPAEGMGKSEQARAWEAAADEVLHNMPAGDRLNTTMAATQKNIAENPWLQKVPPETMTYGVYDRAIGDQTQFGHLIDELRNAVNPESGLPANLRWKYADLDKVTVPQAVQRVHDINAWRAAQKAEADMMRANNAAAALHKDYPDAPYKWVELKAPELNELQQGYSVKPMDKEGWFAVHAPDGRSTGAVGRSPEEAIANQQFGRQALEDALKYEGETMGHCVGGYCPDVLEGRSRIFSLRNKKTGEPHVTIETRPGEGGTYTQDFNHWAGQEGYDLTNPADLSEARAAFAAQVSPETAETIVQIKGSGKKDRSQRIRLESAGYKDNPDAYLLPYIQDFVRSGKWGHVGDLENTGLMSVEGFKHGGMDPKVYEAVRSELGDFATMDDIVNAAERHMGKPAEGFARGGEVDLAAEYNPLEMEYIIGNVNGYAEGGSVETAHIPYDEAKISSLVNALREELHA